ncbi:hypothetical protein EUTSA_v10027566mg, partial [Eutrema salsugineum]
KSEISNERPRLNCFPMRCARTGFFIFSSSFEQEKSDSLQVDLEMTIPSLCLYPWATFASTHGLIWFSKGGLFLVCNPSTKKVTTLPCIGARTHLGYDPVDAQCKALTKPNYPYPHQKCVVHEVLALGGGGGDSESSSSWRRKKDVITKPYHSVTKSVCINGFIYYGAGTPTRDEERVLVCFDVRYERISFITAPAQAVSFTMLIEYKGKLASIARHPLRPFLSFDLWILEDVTNHKWSKQTCTLPFSLAQEGRSIFSPGTNNAGDIIFAPHSLSKDVQPYYIFYYNVERKDIRRVRLQGLADTQEFRHRYGLVQESYLGKELSVYMAPQHAQSIASL